MANKKMKTIDFGSGDVYELTPDWEKIDGRPFGESTTYGDTLTWDGNTDGKAIVGDMVCHISDAVPTIEDCANGVMATFADSSTAMGTATPIGEGLLMLADSEGILCVATDNLEFNGMVFPKKGIYVIYDGLYVSSLTINGYNGFEKTEITPVPSKYLDFIETSHSDTVTWDGNTDGLSCIEGMAYKVTDASPTFSEAQSGGSYTICAGSEFIHKTFTSEHVVDALVTLGVDGFLIYGEVGIVCLGIADDFDMDGLVLAKGLYVFSADGLYVSSFTTNGYDGFPKGQLKKEYLPEPTVFYIGTTDKYIYKDAELTVKLTRAELASVVCEPIRLFGRIEGLDVWMNPSGVILQEHVGNIIVSTVGGTTEQFVTAEYTG